MYEQVLITQDVVLMSTVIAEFFLLDTTGLCTVIGNITEFLFSVLFGNITEFFFFATRAHIIKHKMLIFFLFYKTSHLEKSICNKALP